MTILAIGYYDDSARFFKSIKKALQKKIPNMHFKYINIYPSGYFYGLVNWFNSSLPIAFIAWLRVLIHKRRYSSIVDNQYHGIDLEKLISFETKLNSFDSIQKTYLRYQACAYIDIIQEIFLNFQPKVLLLSDDSRLVVEVMKYFAIINRVKILYFEQGPFGTTILDDNGVNANSSIRTKTLGVDMQHTDLKLKQINAFFQRKKSIKYRRLPFYRGFDYISEYLFGSTFLYPIDLVVTKKKLNNSDLYTHLIEQKKIEVSQMDGKDNYYILLVLQVPSDVNLIYHSPFFNNHFEIVQAVYYAMPDKCHLIIREHPLYKSKYETQLYEFISDNTKIYIDTKSGLNKMIDASSVVIVNNSTVGIESIARFKSTIVLGNSYYDNESICFKLKCKEDLSLLISSALVGQKNRDLIVEYLYSLCFEFLIDGHFRDNELEGLAMSISQKVGVFV